MWERSSTKDRQNEFRNILELFQRDWRRDTFELQRSAARWETVKVVEKDS